jgi:hypothetical protein
VASNDLMGIIGHSGSSGSSSQRGGKKSSRKLHWIGEYIINVIK